MLLVAKLLPLNGAVPIPGTALQLFGKFSVRVIETRHLVRQSLK